MDSVYSNDLYGLLVSVCDMDVANGGTPRHNDLMNVRSWLRQSGGRL